MLKKTLLALFVAVMVSGLAWAQPAIEYIEIAVATGGDTDFDADTGTLTWSGGAGGVAYMADWTDLTFDNSTINVTMTAMNDQSSGGQARAFFNSGTFDVSFSDDILGEVLRVQGDVNWFREVETGVTSNYLFGEGIFMPNSVTIDDGGFFPAGTQWHYGPTGKSGWNSDTYSLNDPLGNPGYDIEDYGQDFSAESLILTIFADSSYIPEPATLVLLGLGGLGLIRRRR